jgi:protein-tyrosine phosphatase
VKELQTVLFLCTGNFYRSRYAEAWFNFHSPRSGLDWRAESRGFRPHLATESLSHHASGRLSACSVPADLTSRYPARLEEMDLIEASLVIAMLEEEHRPMMQEQFPRWADRIRYWNIHDIDRESPCHVLPLIEAEVETLIQQLLSGHALRAVKNLAVEF